MCLPGKWSAQVRESCVHKQNREKSRSLESLFWRSWSSEIVSGKVLGCSKLVSMVTDRFGVMSGLISSKLSTSILLSKDSESA